MSPSPSSGSRRICAHHQTKFPTGSLGLLWGGDSHPPGRNERPDEFEVGRSDAKAYGCRQDTDGPAAAAGNRCRRDETPGRCEGGRFAPCRSDEIRLASTSSLDRDESESTRDWGAPAPHRKESRSPGEWQPIPSPKPRSWRSLATRLRFRLKIRSWRSLATSLRSGNSWRLACEAVIAGDSPAKGVSSETGALESL